jgi:hypothetical protein
MGGGLVPEHLKTYGLVYQTIGLLVTLAINIVFVVLTYRTLKETRLSRLTQSNPAVVAGIELRKWTLVLFIRNAGRGTASSLVVSFEPALPIHGSKEPLSLLNLPVLPPDKEWARIIGFAFDQEAQASLTYKVTATYVTPEKQSEAETFILDTSRYIESGQAYDVLYQAVDHLDKIEDNIRDSVRSLNAIKDRLPRR